MKSSSVEYRWSFATGDEFRLRLSSANSLSELDDTSAAMPVERGSLL